MRYYWGLVGPQDHLPGLSEARNRSVGDRLHLQRGNGTTFFHRVFWTDPHSPFLEVLSVTLTVRFRGVCNSFADPSTCMMELWGLLE